jgi:glucose/arabinose dehydrogenase
MKRSLLIAVIVLLCGVIITTFSSAAVEADTASEPIAPLDIFPAMQFTLPTVITNAGDERLFIAEQAGRIWVVNGEGSGAARTLFLDISEQVLDGCERGLLGLAFHPQYAQNGYFFVNYITLVDDKEYTRISRFQVTADPDTADPQSELVLMEIEQPYCNHNGGDLHFDPQGMLVIGLGDGGLGGDPHENSQNPQSYLGKLLRIDVDGQDDGLNYAIPADNPFVDQENVLDEIWALGLRNPWRFSFDVQTGDLTIGDVGQDSWEEVNFVPAAAVGGQNFEWSIKEGFADYKPDQPAGPGVMAPPVYVYAHNDDEFCESITGGFVYRGQQMSALFGTYIYANFCDGRIYGLQHGQAQNWINTLLADTGSNIVTFGQDQQNELYFADRQDGRIYRLVSGLDRQVYLPLTLQ